MLTTISIERALGKFAPAVMFSPKKSRALQKELNNRKPSTVALHTSYSSYLVEEWLASQEQSRVVSNLVSNSGSWRIGLEETDRVKTAFTSNHVFVNLHAWCSVQKQPFFVQDCPHRSILLNKIKAHACITYRHRNRFSNSTQRHQTIRGSVLICKMQQTGP